MSEEYIEGMRALRPEQTHDSYIADRALDGSAPTTDSDRVDFAGPLHRAFGLRGRGNAPVRQAAVERMQRTYGNRAVQRRVQGEYEPALPPFLMGPATMGLDYLLHRLGPSSLPPLDDPRQPTIAQMVQKQIRSTQAIKDSIERRQGEQHEKEISSAERAITGDLPEWSWWEDASMGMSAEPEYADVSPALNPYELRQLEEERDTMGSMGDY